MRAAAAQLATDVSAGQPDGACRSEFLVGRHAAANFRLIGALGVWVLAEVYVACDLYPVGAQCVLVFIDTIQLGTAAPKLATDGRVQQPDGTARNGYLVEEHVAADLHPVGQQRVAAVVKTGCQLGFAAVELACDVCAYQPDLACERRLAQVEILLTVRVSPDSPARRQSVIASSETLA